MKDDSLSPDEMFDLAREAQTGLERIFASLLATQTLYDPEDEQWRVVTDTMDRIAARAELIQNTVAVVRHFDH